jgi:hypothetical protein
MAEVSGDIQVSGFVEKQAMFEHLLTTDPRFDLNTRAVIRNVLQEARKKVSKDAASYIENDPRKAARAIKHTVYKQIFGGNISILQKRKAGPKYELQRQRTLQPGQVGGNRRPRVESRNRLDQYYGSDRGFILRFLNAGTVNRETRYGSRGAIGRTNWFGHVAPWHMETAAQDVANAINEYVKQQANG